MATVFFSFGLAEAVLVKAIRLGMGLAVMVDATISSGPSWSLRP
jgi:hypothetical protein